MSIILKFLYHVSNLKVFNNISLLSAYLLSHESNFGIGAGSANNLSKEFKAINERSNKDISTDAYSSPIFRKVLSADDMLGGGTFVKGN